MDTDARLQDLLDHASELIQCTDLEGNVQFVNRAWCRKLGYSREEALNLNFRQVVDPDWLEHYDTVFECVLEGEDVGPFEAVFMTRDGRRVFVEGTLDCRLEEGRPAAARGFFRDLTDFHRQRREFEQFFKISVELLCVADLDGHFLRCNPAWSATLGYSSEELLQRPYIEFVHPDDREATLTEARNLRREGAETIGFENRYRCKDGTYRWLMWSVASDGEHLYAAARDVTDRKRMEECLRAARRVAEEASLAKSTFLAAVSRELRAALDVAPGSAGRVETIVASGRRLLGLIDDLLDLSKLEAGRVELHGQSLDLGAALREATAAVKNLLEEKSQTLDLFVPALPPVRADSLRLRQILDHLLSRAIQFTPEGGALQVSAGREDGAVSVSVTSNGAAFVRGAAEPLLTPFQGSGLGLALARRLVKLHGGRIWVDSEGTGEGGRLTFTLPVASA
ncbi:MAG: PAS domain S-box protein [Armatimonadetes bacterium]|nr:PAS domain S-box protein [Armatimonadota bacterium]